jgi:CRISPR-associated protein Cmr4
MSQPTSTSQQANRALVFWYAQTPTHAGSQSTGPVIDQEIQRSAITGYPQFNDSTVKGSVKAHFRSRLSAGDLGEAFGSDPGVNPTKSGGLTFFDAHLIALPVQASRCTFVWVTCPYALSTLNRCRRDFVGDGAPPTREVLSIGESKALSPSGFPGGEITLHDFVFEVSANQQVTDLAKWITENALPPAVAEDRYWVDRWKKNLLVISDESFAVLSTVAMDIRAHNVLNLKTKTSKNLFFAEDLPNESLLVSPVAAAEQASKTTLGVLDELASSLIWLGGDQSNGHGGLWTSVYTKPVNVGASE